MSNELRAFTKEEFGTVRTMIIDGEPWFVGKEVAECLGYANARDALKKHVDDEDKGVAKCDTLGGTQSLVVVNESGMYSLVLGSKLPSAKKFKRWITSEVIPSIRKNGMYATDDLLNNLDLLISVATQLKEEREQKKKLEVMNAAKDQVICELKPKADYTDEILKCPGTVTITQIAKDYGMSGTKMNKILNELGVQFKKSGQWFIYEKYNGKGYTKSQTVQIERHGVKDCGMNTKWTQKGRLFLYELLKNEGIYPSIEKTDIIV